MRGIVACVVILLALAPATPVHAHRALVRAACQGDLKEVTRILTKDKRAQKHIDDVEEVGDEAVAPLDCALSHGWAEVMRVLLQNGATVHVPSSAEHVEAFVREGFATGTLDFLEHTPVQKVADCIDVLMAYQKANPQRLSAADFAVFERLPFDPRERDHLDDDQMVALVKKLWDAGARPLKPDTPDKRGFVRTVGIEGLVKTLETLLAAGEDAEAALRGTFMGCRPAAFERMRKFIPEARLREWARAGSVFEIVDVFWARCSKSEAEGLIASYLSLGGVLNAEQCIELVRTPGLVYGLDHGCTPPMRDKNGWTMLTAAIINDVPDETLKIIEAHGADPNERDREGDSSLAVLYHRAHGEVPAAVRRWLAATAAHPIPQADKNKLLEDAVMNRQGAWVEVLLQAGASPVQRDGKGHTLVERALDQNCKDEAKVLMAWPAPSERKIVELDMIIGGGARTQDEARPWLQAWSPVAKKGEYRREYPFIEFAFDFPRVVESAQYDGLKPGFWVTALGLCAPEAGTAVMPGIRAVMPGAYVRRVKVPEPLVGSCPRALPVAAAASVKTQDGAMLAAAAFVVDAKEQNVLWLARRQGVDGKTETAVFDPFTWAHGCTARVRVKDGGLAFSETCAKFTNGECDFANVTAEGTFTGEGQLTVPDLSSDDYLRKKRPIHCEPQGD